MSEINKYGVFSVVGKQSLHYSWMSSSKNFDLHLIVYDQSFNDYREDTPYITVGKGHKFKLIYTYLTEHPVFLEKYDFYYFPDDDILIDAQNIEKLFGYMEKFRLDIAQPALYDSYYTFNHTLRKKDSILRYTNFVEMMQPCFSRDALKKVLFTFNENECGWGMDYHWGKIIDFKSHEMAIIDDVMSVHTRPIRSFNKQNRKELHEYLTKYNLNPDIKIYDIILKERYLDAKTRLSILGTEEIKEAEICLNWIVNVLVPNANTVKTSGLFEGTTGISLFFFEYYRLSGKRKYYDWAFSIFEKSISDLSAYKKDISLSNGLAGVVWIVEYLAQHNFIENNTSEVLEEIIHLTNSMNIHTISNYDIQDGLSGYGLQLIMRINNPAFSKEDATQFKEKDRIVEVVDQLKSLDYGTLPRNTLIDIIVFLNKLSGLNIQKDVVDRLLFNYVELIFRSEAYKNNYLTNLVLSIVLYNTSSILNNNDWKNAAIQHALSAMDDEIIDSLTDIYTILGIALIFNQFYQYTHHKDFHIYSLKLFKKGIYKLPKEGQYLLIPHNLKGEPIWGIQSGLAGIGLMIISFLSDYMPEWFFYLSRDKHAMIL